MKNYKIDSRPIKFFDETSTPPFFTHIISRGDEYAYHSHDFYEIVYIQEGEITHIVNDEFQELKFGNILFLRPADRHVYIRKNRKCSHRDLIFEAEFFKETCSFLNPNLLSNYSSPKSPVLLSITQQQINKLENIILKINQLLNKTDCKNTLVKILLIELLSIFCEKTFLIKNKHTYPDVVNQILENINLNFQERLYKILEPLKYDNAYLSRLFKSCLNKTMSQYLVEVRLEYVVSQLKLTNKTILAISNDAGFSSVSHLNKLFKAKFGITPTQFKNTNN